VRAPAPPQHFDARRTKIRFAARAEDRRNTVSTIAGERAAHPTRLHHRRAVALFPILPLATGFFAGTLPDSIVRSALMAAVAVLAVAGFLLLRTGARPLDARGGSEVHRRSHGLVVALIGLLAAMAVADGLVRKVTGVPLVDGDGWISITVTAVLVGALIPAAVQTWRRTAG
jgi:hypothetical protein